MLRRARLNFQPRSVRKLGAFGSQYASWNQHATDNPLERLTSARQPVHESSHSDRRDRVVSQFESFVYWGPRVGAYRLDKPLSVGNPSELQQSLLACIGGHGTVP
ncbi:hypothetical protein MPC4_110003 [Methylocella tundrae]|uniref:Uncharacterized protein n=1 Tax=Methylocella tundrae TaxID=227605 RepID=A0A8B6M2W9_METTU|nr:hypothetical protein MPC4_110003 [Methylocella tundrae]